MLHTKLAIRASLGILFFTTLLAGCEDSSNPNYADFVFPDPVSTTVVPSLGLIRNATVHILDVDGNEVPGATGELNDTGTIELFFSAATPGPLFVEVLGDDDAEYFDESTGTFLPFPTGSSLRAVIPGQQDSVGVTPLTEVAAARFVATGGSTPDDASAANEEVRARFLPGVSDITAPPAVVSDTSDALGDSEADLYATYLGTLANLGQSQEAPALAVTEQLAEDFTDGSFDSAIDGTPITEPVFDNSSDTFQATFDEALNEAISDLGGSDLSSDDFVDAVGSTTPDDSSAGADGSSSGADGSDGADGSSSGADGSDGSDGADGSGNGSSDGDSSGGDSTDGSGDSGDADQICLATSATPTDTTLPESILGMTINFTGSFISDGASPGFALNDSLVFKFGDDGSLTQNDVLISDKPYTCGTNEIFWYDATNDKLLALSFTSSNEINEFNFNNANGDFLAQATPATTDGGSGDSGTGDVDAGGSGDGTDTGGTDTGDGTDNSGDSSDAGDSPFGAGYKPTFPTNIPDPITPGTPVDVRGSVPALYAEWIASAKALIVQPATGVGVIKDLDGIRNSYTLSVLNNEGLPVQSVSYQLGPDGVHQTSDDIITGYQTLAADATSRFGYSASYHASHPGADNTWFTDDDIFDEVLSYGAQVINSDNLLFALGSADVQTRLETGPDNILFTADDTYGGRFGFIVAVLDGDNHQGQVVVFDDGGFTDDETIISYSMANFDGDNAVQTVTYTGAGEDKLWFTADDEIGLVVVGVINSDNRIEYLLTYNAEGADGAFFTDDDELSSITVFEYTATGEVRYRATHTDAGADGEWFTADDSGSAIANRYDSEDKLLSQTTSNNIGADAIWFTGDDQLSGYQIRELDSAGQETFVGGISDAGADETWFTSDDLPSFGGNRKSFDSDGNITQQIYYKNTLGDDGASFSNDDVNYYNQFLFAGSQQLSGLFVQPGEDGVAFTADDVASGTVDILDSAGNKSKSLGLSGPGADGIWYTDDDTISFVTVFVYEAGEIIGQNNFTDAGADELFDTADDVQTGASRTSDTGNNTTTTISYNAAGDDGMWGTSDDVVASYLVFTLNDAGLRTQEVHYDEPGTDGIFFTDDDIPSSYSQFEYNDNGKVTLSYSVYSPGVDDKFFTADDLTTPYARLEYDSEGNTISQITFGNPGPDGLYLTSDDIATSGQISGIDAAYVTNTATNAGFIPTGCPVDQSNSGSLLVQVRDTFANPVTGAVVQLDAAGETVVTGSDGNASFASVSGSHDVHIFANDYSWESFACVAPTGEVTLTSRLNKKVAADSGGTRVDTDESSLIALTPGSGQFGKVILALIDDTGTVLGTNVGQPGANEPRPGVSRDWANIPFFPQFVRDDIYILDTPAGTSVTGEIWAYHYDNEALIEAVKVAESTSYTTLALGISGQEKTDAETSVTITFSDTGFADLETIYNTNSGTGIFRLGNRLGSSIVFSSPSYVLKQPLGLPAGLAFVDSINYQFLGSQHAISITAIPESGIDESFTQRASNILRGPEFADQDTMSLPNPSISWLPAAQNISDSWLSIQTITLDNFDPNNEWQIHAPAGVSEFAFPAIPSSIDVTNFEGGNGFYNMDIRVFSAAGLGYQEAIGTRELRDLPVGENYDEIQSATRHYKR